MAIYIYIYLYGLAATGSSEIVRRIFEGVSFSITALFNFHTFCFPMLIAFTVDLFPRSLINEALEHGLAANCVSLKDVSMDLRLLSKTL